MRALHTGFARSHKYRSLKKINSITSMTYLEPGPSQLLGFSSCNDRVAGSVLICLSNNHKRYAVDYQGQRIGIIKPGINCWYAEASLQFGAFANQLNTRIAAVNWLVDNYSKVEKAGIKFDVSENLSHYTIERNDWLIKIDVTPEDCIALINQGVASDLEYFPDLKSAIIYSFDLILSPSACCCQEF